MQDKLYGIMRIEKRNASAVGGLEQEANRSADHQKDFKGSDINWDLTKDNVHLVRTDNWLKSIRQDIADRGIKKPRKDAILMLDGLYTASPEYFKDKSHDEIMQYFKDCLQFHIDTYCHGDESLVKNAVVHFDETTPHLQICSIPITEDNRLSAKDIMGNLKAYHERQNLFYEQISKDRGLERGEIRDHGDRRAHIEQMVHKRDQADHEANCARSEVSRQNRQITNLSHEIDNLEDHIHSLEDKILELDIHKESRSADLERITANRDDVRSEYDNMVETYNSMLRDIQEFKRQRKEISETREAVVLAAQEKISTNKIIQRIRRDLPKIVGKTPEEQKYISDILEHCISLGIESQQQSHEKLYRDSQHFLDDDYTR